MSEPPRGADAAESDPTRFDHREDDTSMTSRRTSLLEASPNPVMIYRDGVILWVNSTARSILGGEPVGSQVVDYVVDADRERIARRIASIQEGHVEGPARLTITTSEGPRIIESSATLIAFEGRPAVQTTWRDLTDVERLRTWLESLADSTSDLIGISDRTGLLQYMNEALMRFRGETDRAGLPDGRNVVSHVAPAQDEIVREVIEALETSGHWRGEIELLGPDGPIPISAVIERHTVAETVFYSMIGRDITAERRLRAELRQTITERDAMAARLAHEIRNPLSGVIGTALLLRDGTELSSDQAELVELIIAASSDVQWVVEDLSTFVATHRSQLHIETHPVDVRDAVDSVVSLMKTTTNKGFEISGRDVAIGDDHRIRQIIRNLCSNAIRYGGDTIRLDIERTGGDVVLHVTDDGDGVPATESERIFADFASAHNGSISASMGLGLSVARQLARDMDGDLVYRRRAEETVFTLRLPGVSQ